jgi:hypothetical protein
MEHDLQQHVAELVADRVGVVGVDRLEQLVGLLQQVAGERAMRLFRIPRTPTGTPQARHHADHVEHTFALTRRRHRPGRDVGEQLVRVRGPFGHGVGETVAGAVVPVAPDVDGVALGSVLWIATTVRVSQSKRPNFGLTSRFPSWAC